MKTLHNTMCFVTGLLHKDYDRNFGKDWMIKEHLVGNFRHEVNIVTQAAWLYMDGKKELDMSMPSRYIGFVLETNQVLSKSCC